jgi:L-ascorbate oxidase
MVAEYARTAGAGWRALAMTMAWGVLINSAPGHASDLLDPPVFKSSGGVLDIMVIAQATPLTSLDISGPQPTGWIYTVCPRPAPGTTCPANADTVSPYGGVRLALQPGDRLKIRFVNNLPPVPPDSLDRIHDDPLLALNPSNLHTHGLIVAPAPNTAPPPRVPVYGDFIFTSVFNPANGNPAAYDPGAYTKIHAHGDVVSTGAVDYDIQIPANHPSGSYWFHPHMHGLALNQLSAGLSGIISIGNVANYACADESCRRPVPESAVRHLILKDMQVLSDNTGFFQEDPAFCGEQSSDAPLGEGVCPGDPSAYAGGQWFFTVNGQRYPKIPVATADGEVWRFTNASGSASYDLRLVDDQTQSPMAVQILSIDGVALSLPPGATSGQMIGIGGNRLRLAPCGAASGAAPGVISAASAASALAPFSAAPVCATEIVMMPASRVETYVVYRDGHHRIAAAPEKATATLLSAGINTGPGGDSWPAVKLAKVVFPKGRSQSVSEALHLKAQPSPEAVSASIASAGVLRGPSFSCQPLAAGHHRRIYFGNPNVPDGTEPGTDQYGNAIFGLGYEEIDENGQPVPGTFQDIKRFDPADTLCVRIKPGETSVTETWELYNLATELHNFHIHQTKFHKIDPAAPADSPLNPASKHAGVWEDTAPLPVAEPGPGSQPTLNPEATSCSIADFKAGRCTATPIYVRIPFTQPGTFVFHCHILEHEDGGMMRAVRVAPASN